MSFRRSFFGTVSCPELIPFKLNTPELLTKWLSPPALKNQVFMVCNIYWKYVNWKIITKLIHCWSLLFCKTDLPYSYSLDSKTTKMTTSNLVWQYIIITQLTFNCLKPTIEKLQKGWNMFKVNNNNTRTMSMVSFRCFLC